MIGKRLGIDLKRLSFDLKLLYFDFGWLGVEDYGGVCFDGGGLEKFCLASNINSPYDVSS